MCWLVMPHNPFGFGYIPARRYHYLWSWAVNLVGTEAQVEYWHAHATENKLFYGGAVNPRDADVSVRQDPEDPATLIFEGKKTFSTGSKVSDLTILEGVFAPGSAYEGQHVFAAVPSKQPGITYGDEWVDTLGMRGTQSGGIRIHEVRVPFDQAFGWTRDEPDTGPPAAPSERSERAGGARGSSTWRFTPLGPYNTLNLPAIQLVFVSFYQGILEGALARALDYTRHTTRPWPFVPEPTRVSRGTDEAYIQIAYGTLQSKAWATGALLEQVVDQARDILHATPRSAVTAEQRGEWAVRVAATKVAVAEVGLQVTTEVWELQGARAISAKYGFDVAYRDLRTHLLHDPLPHKKAEVGRFALHGVPDGLPTPTWYT